MRMWFMIELYFGLRACNLEATTRGLSVALDTMEEEPPRNCDLTALSFSMASMTLIFPLENHSK